MPSRCTVKPSAPAQVVPLKHTLDLDACSLDQVPDSVLQSQDATLILDLEGRVVCANSVAQRLLSVDQDLLGLSLRDVTASSAHRMLNRLFESLKDNDGARVELPVVALGSNEAIPVEISIGRFEDGSLTRYQCNIHDLRHRKRNRIQLRHAALHDPLTDLPNRPYLLARLSEALSRSEQAVLVLFDLGSLPAVGTTLGYQFADQVLLNVVDRIRLAIIAPGFIARLEGDLFAALLGGDAIARSVVRRLENELMTPIAVSGQRIYLTPRIGLAAADDTYKTADEWLRDADMARNEAAQSDERKACWFRPEMRIRRRRDMIREVELRQALERNELEVHYQPIVDMKRGTVAEFEALVRWPHEQHGLLYPHDFLPHAERAGLMRVIDRYVLERACRQMCQWTEQYPGSTLQRMGVNVSSDYFAQRDFVADLSRILRITGLSPHQLRLEITERAMFKNPDHVPLVLDQLRAAGVSVSLDDFGTGYSSLSYLQKFPVDGLKIDRSFIQAADQHDAVLSSVIALGHALDMTVTAEGVESPQQFAIVSTFGCTYGQGFYFAKALSPEDAGALIEDAPNWR